MGAFYFGSQSSGQQTQTETAQINFFARSSKQPPKQLIFQREREGGMGKGTRAKKLLFTCEHFHLFNFFLSPNCRRSNRETGAHTFALIYYYYDSKSPNSVSTNKIFCKVELGHVRIFNCERELCAAANIQLKISAATPSKRKIARSGNSLNETSQNDSCSRQEAGGSQHHTTVNAFKRPWSASECERLSLSVRIDSCHKATAISWIESKQRLNERVRSNAHSTAHCIFALCRFAARFNATKLQRFDAIRGKKKPFNWFFVCLSTSNAHCTLHTRQLDIRHKFAIWALKGNLRWIMQ